MPRKQGWCFVVLLAAASGCAHHGHGAVHGPGRAETEMRLVGRSAQNLVLPAQAALLPAACPREGDGPYRELTEKECQCLAAANASVAALLRMENALSARADSRSCCTQGEPGSLHRRLRSLREVQIRNEAAREALLRYYDLVEAESGRQTTCRSLTIIETTLQDLDRMAADGVLLDGTAQELRRRRLELQQQQAEIVVTIDGLNRTLYYLLGMGDMQPHPIWPTIDLTIDPLPLSVEQGVSLALSQRAELQILRVTRAENSEENLPIVRSVLQQSDPSLGVPPGKQSWLCKLLKLNQDDELATRDGQLSRLILENQEQISSQVQGFVTSANVRAQQTLLAQTQVEHSEQTLQNIRQLRALGRGDPLAPQQTELQVLQLRQSLFARYLAWKRARVELAAAEGLLALECGYGYHAHGCKCH